MSYHNIHVCVGDQGKGHGQAEPVAADGQGWRRSGLSSQENESHAGKESVM